MTSYLLDNAVSEATPRFDSLEMLFDATTTRHIRHLGVAKAWRCLEIGGGGSIAMWLAEQVGAEGHVTATDIDARHLEHLTRPNLEVLTHDIVTDPLARSDSHI